MCGRYTLRRDYQRIRHDLGVESGSGSVIFNPRYNVAPTDAMPILHLGEHGQRQLSQMVLGHRHIRSRQQETADEAH